jgi:hypothetical protein
VQLYSTLLLEGCSRTILAGSLTPAQDVGVVLYVYYLALLEWGRWREVMSDHGGQFRSHDFKRVNRRLAIHHEMYEKGHPWRNLIESQFGIQARVGEYAWERCGSVAAAEEIHRALIRDHNRLPHFAHRKRGDNKKTPVEVLGAARGQAVEPAALHQAFSRKFWQRRTDARGFVRVGRWRIYVEEGLPRTPIEVIYWDGRLRAEYRSAGGRVGAPTRAPVPAAAAEAVRPAVGTRPRRGTGGWAEAAEESSWRRGADATLPGAGVGQAGAVSCQRAAHDGHIM